MFGKWYAQTYTGSMFGAGSCVFAVWSYVVANAKNESVELNPVHLAATLGDTVEKVNTAIEYLCAPDPASRNPKAEGRRLVRQGQFIYHVPTFLDYRSMRDENDRREYNRIRQSEYRHKSKTVKNECHSRVAEDMQYTEAEAEKNSTLSLEPLSTLSKESISQNQEQELKNAKFQKPTLDEVAEYCLERKNTIDPEAFLAFYESKGWKVGNQPMKSWKSAIITWEKRENKTGGGYVTKAERIQQNNLRVRAAVLKRFSKEGY